MPDHSTAKKVLAVSLLLWPVLSILGFALHFHSIHGFFNFQLERPSYDAGRLFEGLAAGRGHGFVMAHFIVYLATPFLLVILLILSWFLFRSNQCLAFVGAAIGIIGCVAMAGVVSSWLSFAAIGRVQPQYYDGARAALIELTNKQGFLKWNTGCSYLAFIGLMLLAAGLWRSRQFPKINMICILLGALLFIFFMDMDNWMLIGSILLSVGLLPVIKRLWSNR
ncbi:MAG TPA: hypothetical protein VNS58_07885 [Puia sp.]|nr:hypothetical protein [Puia sp.]